jgi:PKD repeat protein
MGKRGAMGGKDLRRRGLRIGVVTLVLAVTSTTALAARPDGDFVVDPDPPNQGQPTTLTCEPCPDDDDVTVTWRIEEEGEPEVNLSGREVTHTFTTAGAASVRMRLSHPEDGSRNITRSVEVNGSPEVAFDYAPADPLSRQNVTFSGSADDPEDDDIVSVEWDFGDGEEASGFEVVHSFDEPGTYTVSFTATDERGASRTHTREVVVRANPGPAASFLVSPTIPVVGGTATLTSTSRASSGGTIVETRWDLNDDGRFDDAAGSPVSWSFTRAGKHEIALFVRQDNGQHAFARRIIRVNSPPTARFTWSPLSPVAGEWVDFRSTSVDREGELTDQSWDLDGDGNFGDASGPTARYPFTVPGTYTVGLRVTDSDGLVRTTQRQLVVQAAPAGPGPEPPVDPGPGAGPDPGPAPEPVGPTPPSPTPRPLRLMSPFPIVRIAGAILPRATLIRVLSVRAPRGSRVRVRCRGKGCPVGAVARTSATRVIRFPRFERRLRAGIRLHLFVRQPGRIGKYTRFVIRAGAAPKRLDRCLFPGTRSPAPCP